MINHQCQKGITGYKHTSISLVIKSVIAGTLLSAVTQANAASWELDNGVTIDLDSQIGYIAQWRMEKQNTDFYDPAKNFGLAVNADDGNRSFNRYDMTQNKFSAASELDISYDGDSFSGGVFVRGRGFFDQVYTGKSANQSVATCNQGLTTKTGAEVIAPLPGLEKINIVTGAGNCSDFSANKGIRDYHRSRVEFLDAFFYSNFDIAGQGVSLRIGDQVVSWGESLALYGGVSSAQGPIDVSKSFVPGVELKDIFLPIGQVYVETSLTDVVSLGAYYQYEWERSRIDSPGSFMSMADIIGEGIKSMITPTPLGIIETPMVRDEPKAGQWGISLRYLAESLNSTEFGFYYINYNDVMPTFELEFTLIPGSTMALLGDPTGTAVLLPSLFTLKYFDDIDLYGFSFGTVIGDTNVSGEITYRDGQPVQINAASLGNGFHNTRAKTIQAQVSVLHILANNSLADSMTFIGEIGLNQVLSIDATAITAAAGIDVDNLSQALDNDKFAAGYLLKLTADYFNIGPALDLKVSATLKHDFQGTSAIGFTFSEDKIDLGLGVDFTYLSKHTFGGKYVAFLTSTEQILEDGRRLEFGHQFADRDNISIYYKFNF